MDSTEPLTSPTSEPTLLSRRAATLANVSLNRRLRSAPVPTVDHGVDTGRTHTMDGFMAASQ